MHAEKVCMCEALLIKLMDSGRSLLRAPGPLSLLPAISAINTLPEQIPLANVTREIHYGEGRRCKGAEERGE